jgi:hypothetical protein
MSRNLGLVDEEASVGAFDVPNTLEEASEFIGEATAPNFLLFCVFD